MSAWIQKARSYLAHSYNLSVQCSTIEHRRMSSSRVYPSTMTGEASSHAVAAAFELLLQIMANKLKSTAYVESKSCMRNRLQR
jgi:hypothetical protein